ncbi:MAG: hypothetical protein KGJ03_11310, partial [Betaproteobacteria bacterium]|nr:hypothetical protein [Betaproteobacteria bacterium]
LQGWRDELYERAMFDVARRIALSSYKLRDVLGKAASFQRNMQFIGIGIDVETDDWLLSAFEEQLAQVTAAIQEVEASALEAEALLEKSIQRPMDALKRCALNASIALGNNVSALRRHKQGSAVEQIHTSPAEDSALKEQIADAIHAMEDVLRPVLAARRPKRICFALWRARHRAPRV